MDSSSRRLAVTLGLVVAVLLGIGYYGVLMDTRAREETSTNVARASLETRVERLEKFLQGGLLLDAKALAEVVDAVKAARIAHDAWTDAEKKVSTAGTSGKAKAMTTAKDARKKVDTANDLLQERLDGLLPGHTLPPANRQPTR
jgi:hypothetical protein